MNYQDYPENDPRHHTIQVRQRFDDLVTHLREDVKKVDDPHARAMFETAAEVISGLSTAFSHFEQKSEVAWK
jgi:hypothetical protein